MKINISERALNSPASAIRKLVPLADKAKKKGIKVYHLNIGQPDLETPKPIIDAIKKFSLNTLEYAPSEGMHETIAAWQKFYHDKSVKFDSSEIIVTSGGSEGLILAFLTVADPGDELLVFEPFYTSYAIMAAMGNIVLKALPTEVEDGYHLPPKAVIEKAISRKTRGIVLCNPNNPTGTMYTPDEVRMIADIALKHNLFIISDETYQEIVFDDKKVLPFMSMPQLHNRLIVTDSVSKRFNSCGARIGCVACKNKEVMSAIMRFAQARLSVATVDQLALIPVLTNSHKYTESVKKNYKKRRDMVVAELRKIKGVSFVIPEGAFYIMPRIPVDDSDKFAEFLLNDFSDKRETVMIAPATGFYKNPQKGKDKIRIAYVLSEDKLQRAIRLLGMALEKYNRKK